MEQPELPGMPEPRPIVVDGAPRMQEHVTMKVYPPTPERETWFTLISHQWPGGTWSNAAEHGAAYTPDYIGRWLTDRLRERMIDLEPF